MKAKTLPFKSASASPKNAPFWKSTKTYLAKASSGETACFAENKAIKTTEERINWNTEVDGKAPALDYFKALATRMCQDDINMLAKKEGNLERFKNTYRTIEEKINSLKKRQEAIKFEEFGDKN